MKPFENPVATVTAKCFLMSLATLELDFDHDILPYGAPPSVRPVRTALSSLRFSSLASRVIEFDIYATGLTNTY